MKLGFTLIEILLIIILISFVIGFSTVWYNKLNQSSFLIDEAASSIVNFLNLAKQKAIINEGNNNWGVILINNQNNHDFVSLFEDIPTQIKQKLELPGQVEFIDPTTSSPKIIIFQKLTGETNATTIKLNLIGLNDFKIIFIPTSGAIYVTSSL